MAYLLDLDDYPGSLATLPARTCGCPDCRETDDDPAETADIEALHRFQDANEPTNLPEEG